MIVYLITNRINGKVYVGKTTLSLEQKRVFSAESRLKMSEAAKSRKNKQISSTIMGAFNG